MWPWEKKPEPAAAPITAQPIVVNPNPAENQDFAAYRADAICREIEQRKQENRPLHPQHSQIVGEAKMYAHSLQAAGVWAEDRVASFIARLDAACKAD